MKKQPATGPNIVFVFPGENYEYCCQKEKIIVALWRKALWEALKTKLVMRPATSRTCSVTIKFTRCTHSVMMSSEIRAYVALLPTMVISLPFT